MLLLHGFTATWRAWDLVLPSLERRHDVLAPTLPGHAGGPPLAGDVGAEPILGAVERAMDDAGFQTAHVVGNSLGGYLALRLAARGRARSVVALAPAGGWAPGDPSYEETMAVFTTMERALGDMAPNADAIMATDAGRRQATQFLAERYEHIPADWLVHQMIGAASIRVGAMIDSALRDAWTLGAGGDAGPARV